MKLEVETEGLRRLGIVAIGMAVYLLWVFLLWNPIDKHHGAEWFLAVLMTVMTGVVLFAVYGLVYWIAEGFGKNLDLF